MALLKVFAVIEQGLGLQKELLIVTGFDGCIRFVTKSVMSPPQVCWRTGSTNLRNALGSSSSAGGMSEVEA